MMEIMTVEFKIEYRIKYKNNIFVIVLKIKSFITVIITNLLHQYGKPYIYCCCKRISLFLLATKRKRKIICLHEPGNAFDRFTIKTVSKNGEVVGHLPREISTITKYFLE